MTNFRKTISKEQVERDGSGMSELSPEEFGRLFNLVLHEKARRDAEAYGYKNYSGQYACQVEVNEGYPHYISFVGINKKGWTDNGHAS